MPFVVGRSSVLSVSDLLETVRRGDLGRSASSSLGGSKPGALSLERPILLEKELKDALFGRRDFFSGVDRSGDSPILPAPGGILLSRRRLRTVPSRRSPRGLSALGVAAKSGTMRHQSSVPNASQHSYYPPESDR